jgi:enamine deaminase RidA (YjgF/YER057c/UK114 family)
MEHEVINPESLFGTEQFGFSHAIKAGGTKTIYCAGQVAWDKDFNVVGTDVGTQAKQVLKNLQLVLEAAGATVADLVRIRTYVVGNKPEYLETIGAAIAEFYGDVTPVANTWIGVQSLAMPEFLIEIEATAEIYD